MFALAKKIVQKKLEHKEKPKPRVDTNLPLGLHINAKVTLDETPFIVAKGLMFEFPGEENIVKAYGTFSQHEDVNIFRIYLNCHGELSFLELVIEDDDLVQCRLFRQIEELYPAYLEDSDDIQEGVQYWQHWTGKNGHMRAPEFVITNDDDSEVVYEKAWLGEPQDFTERMHLDAYGDKVDVIECLAMLFGRYLSDDKDAMAEYLLIQSEEDSDGARIALYAGIDINPASLDIL